MRSKPPVDNTLPFKLPAPEHEVATPEECVEILRHMSGTERDYAGQIIAMFLDGEHRLQDLVRRAIAKLDGEA